MGCSFTASWLLLLVQLQESWRAIQEGVTMLAEAELDKKILKVAAEGNF